MKYLWFFLLVSLLAWGQTPAEPVPTTYFGMHINRPADWPIYPVGALGKGTLTSWQYSEPSRGVYDWSRLDTYVNMAQAHGLSFIFTNLGIPEWAVSQAAQTQCSVGAGSPIPSCQAMVQNIQDWDDFVTALATRYRGKLIYELWNEPHANGTYLTVQDMVTLTTHELNVIRATDPGATVLCCAFRAGGNYAFMDKFFAAGGPTQVDAISFHGIFQPPAQPPEAILGKVQTVRGIMAKYGLSSLPLWDSEGGWAVGDPPSDQDKPAFLAKWYILQWHSGIARSYWYAWDGWRPLWDQNTGVNLSGIAYNQVYRWLVGATMAPCSEDANATWTCVLTRDTGYQGLIVWNQNGSISIPVPSVYLQYEDLMGDVVPVASSTFTITQTPVLFENFTP